MSTRAARRHREKDRRGALRKADAAELARVVPRLAPEVLHHLIQQRGLDASGDLITAATPHQVACVLDLDLWRAAAAGQNDQFNGARFGSWLETLMDEGDSDAARVVAAMDKTVSVLGLSSLVRVFDPAVLSTGASSDDGVEAIDVGAESYECEVGGYVVHARTAHAWDAITRLLVALDADYPGDFHALMQGCRRLSNSTPEADGFHELLHEPEQFLYDVSLARGQRRARQGYLTAEDARAFLRLARQPQSSRLDGSLSITAIAADVLRALQDEIESTGASTEAGLTLDEPRALLGSSLEETSAGSWTTRSGLHTTRLTPLQPLLEYVRDTDHVAYFARSRELAFLSNILLAGCALQSRSFTSEEARDAAFGICNLGLEASPPHAPSFLLDHDLVTSFTAGWGRLHEEVTMFVTGRLIATLGDLQSVDLSIQSDLGLLRRELERHREMGDPWRAQADLEAIAMLDVPTWAALCGLLSECPVMPAALTAILERHAGSISPTTFEFFATGDHIRRSREFAERLRDILLR